MLSPPPPNKINFVQRMFLLTKLYFFAKEKSSTKSGILVEKSTLDKPNRAEHSSFNYITAIIDIS